MIDSADQRHAARRSVIVFLAEDNPHIRLLLRLLLEGEGYCVVVAGDGAEALRTLRQIRPAIILLDLDLPVVSGEGVATGARDIHGPAMPVIVFSAAVDGRRRAERLGADGFLAKPFDVDRLVQYVAEAIGACTVCGVSFLTPNPRRLYCSRRCTQRAFTERRRQAREQVVRDRSS